MGSFAFCAVGAEPFFFFFFDLVVFVKEDEGDVDGACFVFTFVRVLLTKLVTISTTVVAFVGGGLTGSGSSPRLPSDTGCSLDFFFFLGLSSDVTTGGSTRTSGFMSGELESTVSCETGRAGEIDVMGLGVMGLDIMGLDVMGLGV